MQENCSLQTGPAQEDASILDNLELGEGDGLLRLRLATPDEVPKLTRAEAFINEDPPGVPQFLRNLQAQNPDLHTDRC